MLVPSLWDWSSGLGLRALLIVNLTRLVLRRPPQELVASFVPYS